MLRQVSWSERRDHFKQMVGRTMSSLHRSNGTASIPCSSSKWWDVRCSSMIRRRTSLYCQMFGYQHGDWRRNTNGFLGIVFVAIHFRVAIIVCILVSGLCTVVHSKVEEKMTGNFIFLGESQIRLVFYITHKSLIDVGLYQKLKRFDLVKLSN